MSNFWSLLFQSALFVLGVYIQKFIRRRLYERQEGKRIKQTSRIITCTIMTTIILLFNYQYQCSSESIGALDCFYMNLDFLQIIHVCIANTLLFSTHIITKFSQNGFDYSRYTIKSVFVAPFLQQLLFRGSFYRSAHDSLPTFVMALLFSLSHLHRSIRKWLKGKNPRWNQSIGQIIFTFVFGVYSFYFLVSFQSVIPSIVLHCYCNFLGPPSINKQNVLWHVLSITLVVAYCLIFI